jgi:hypothetical protein
VLIIFRVDVLACKGTRLIRISLVLMVPVADDDPLVETLFTARQAYLPALIGQWHTPDNLGAKLHMGTQAERFSIDAQVVEHLLRASASPQESWCQ